MLLLLGDQLIRDAGIAVFELVKNAYDADATNVSVLLSHVSDPSKAQVVVEDNGSGMDWDQIVNVWLEPGIDYRQMQKISGYRSPKFNRLPLGEKGVGRFAAHKIGRKIRLVSHKAGAAEVIVEVDWSTFDSKRYLSDARVTVQEREPEYFVNASTPEAQDPLVEAITNSKIGKTEKNALLSIRVGQDRFRTSLLRYWRKCAVSGVAEKSILRAGHIKPWSDSTPAERLDLFNGLLLNPNLDALFNNGLISFDDSGQIIISSKLSKKDRLRLHLFPDLHIKLRRQHQKYLAYHRNHKLQKCVANTIKNQNTGDHRWKELST